MLLVMSALAIASAGERHIWRSQLSTGVGMSVVLVSGKDDTMLRLKVGSASRWIKDVKIAFMRIEVFWHFLSWPFRIIISSRVESMKHVKLECLMAFACM